jgi:hypothetical protein
MHSTLVTGTFALVLATAVVMLTSTPDAPLDTV